MSYQRTRPATVICAVAASLLASWPVSRVLAQAPTAPLAAAPEHADRGHLVDLEYRRGY